ncbi:dendritic cell-specific transmembrane protein [Rhinoraja longicauda]
MRYCKYKDIIGLEVVEVVNVEKDDIEEVFPIVDRTSLYIKMANFKIAAQLFRDLVEVFSSERKPGLKRTLCLILFCLLLGMGTSGILYICLEKLQCNLVVALALCGTFSVVIPGALFFSKYLRCFTLIFLFSCGTKQGRNALITAGTSIVLFNCAQNSFHNLKELVRLLHCHLVDMLVSVQDLLSTYTKIIKWIYQQHKKIETFNLFTFKDELNVYHNIDDDDVKIKLNATKMNIDSLANNIISTLGTFSRVCINAMALMGVLLILLFTWFYIKRFLSNVNFENLFVTNQLLQFDEKQKELGKSHLLQLTKKEKKYFRKIPALGLSKMELKNMARFLAPILINLCIWTIIIMLDYGIFRITDSLKHHMDHLPTINITMSVSFSMVPGLPIRPYIPQARMPKIWCSIDYGPPRSSKAATTQCQRPRFPGPDDLYPKPSKEVAVETMNKKVKILTFLKEKQESNENFASNIDLSKRDCILQPTLSISKIWIPLTTLLAILLLLTLFSAKLTILKIMVLSSFYKETEEDRVRSLHNKILQKRRWAKLFNTEEVLNTTVKTISFWFPIFKMKKNKNELQKRKNKIIYNQNSDEVRIEL